MLSIYIHSTQRFLDIPPDAVLELESLSDIFQQEEGIGEYSIPLDVFWTDNNRLALKFRERVENFNKDTNYEACTVYNSGWPELTNAKLTLLSKAGSFRYRQGKFSITISGTKGLLASAIKNKKLADFDLGFLGIPSGVGSFRELAYLQQTSVTTAPYIRFCPVAIEGFIDEDRKDFEGEFIALNTINNVVVKTDGTWSFARPSSADVLLPVTDRNNPEWKDYRTVPFITVKHVIRQVFSGAGFTLQGDALESTAFDNLVIFNNVSLERYSYGIFQWDDNLNSINPKNHVPDMLASDFLQAIFKGLGIYPVFIDSSNVLLTFNKTTIDAAAVADISNSCSDDFSSDFLDGTAAEDGYKISLATETEDSYYSERVKELTGKNLVATIATVSDFGTVPSSGLTTDDLVYVQAANLYYQVADATAIPVVWEPWGENLLPFVEGNGERQVDLGFSTLATYVVYDEADAIFKVKDYLGTRQKGTYYTTKGDLVKNPFGLRLFYATPPGDATVIPRSYNHNRNAANQLVEAYSLAPGAADSLLKLLQPWQDILQNAEVVQTAMPANDANLELLKNYKKLQHQGTIFFVKKLRRSIPAGAEIKIELVPL